ncbi:MAG: glycosyltransferase [Acidobacteria bacterium]|nr:glycosyltransferase [Acidobacteriota bacterium]
MQVFLTLPAYNEAEALPRLLAAFEHDILRQGYGGRVVIVDDGSTDGTAGVAREWSSRLPVELVQHRENRGLGETIEDGLRRAGELAGADDVIVTMDADDTHSPALIREMAQRINGGYDVVIASRYRPGAQVVGLSALRRLMSFCASILFQVLYPIPGARDYTSGFRAYRAAVVQETFPQGGARVLREKGFASMAEILLRLRRRGVRICEVPMILRYDRKPGTGKMKIGATVGKTLALLARHRFVE